MSLDIERWIAGWRGPAIAALVALLAGLPGLLAMPVLDRDEARFAQATAQMLETRNYVSINFQEVPRFKKPVGIHWLQALSVRAFSAVERREIWPYRIPSLLGAMLAAAALAWGASAFLGPRGGVIAAAILGASFLLSTEAFIGKTDAALCGFTTLSLAALARLYAASKGEAVAGKRVRLLFWLGLAMAILIKGPIGPLVVATTLLALWAWDRKAAWMKDLGWGWGLVLILLIVGPWAMAITVDTDGAFWTGAFNGDLASKLGPRGQEGHGAPPGLHFLLSPVLLFPMTLLLPAALVYGWKERARTGVRFALCWLVPAWIIFELAPTKLPHYPLPMYGAIALLMAAAVEQPVGRISRWLGAGLQALLGVVFAIVAVYITSRYAPQEGMPYAIAVAVLMVLAGATGLWWAISRKAWPAVLAAGVLGVTGHGVLAGAAAPTLKPLWVSQRAGVALRAEGVDPRRGVVPGPVAVVGDEEPSLVFALGTRTQFTDAQGAADAISQGRPAFVDVHAIPEFLADLKENNARAAPVAEVKGCDYSRGKPRGEGPTFCGRDRRDPLRNTTIDLILYKSLETPPEPDDAVQTGVQP